VNVEEIHANILLSHTDLAANLDTPEDGELKKI
jgi:hypothetical protein